MKILLTREQNNKQQHRLIITVSAHCKELLLFPVPFRPKDMRAQTRMIIRISEAL
jgi:hypothetical protein